MLSDREIKIIQAAGRIGNLNMWYWNIVNTLVKTPMPEELGREYEVINDVFINVICTEACYIIDQAVPPTGGRDMSEEEIKHLQKMAEDAAIQRFADKIAAAIDEAKGTDNTKETENYGE